MPFASVSTRTRCTCTFCRFVVISFLAVPAARAAYMMTIMQSGPNVVATGSGSIDTTNLFAASFSSAPAYVQSQRAVLNLGPASNQTLQIYSEVSGPSSFGTNGNNTFANSGSGAPVAIVGFQ